MCFDTPREHAKQPTCPVAEVRSEPRRYGLKSEGLSTLRTGRNNLLNALVGNAASVHRIEAMGESEPPMILLETKRRPSRNIRTGKGGTPEPFDVFDDKIGALEMT